MDVKGLIEYLKVKITHHETMSKELSTIAKNTTDRIKGPAIFAGSTKHEGQSDALKYVIQLLELNQNSDILIGPSLIEAAAKEIKALKSAGIL